MTYKGSACLFFCTKFRRITWIYAAFTTQNFIKRRTNVTSEEESRKRLKRNTLMKTLKSFSVNTDYPSIFPQG